jgi:hypothetical protein
LDARGSKIDIDNVDASLIYNYYLLFTFGRCYI